MELSKLTTVDDWGQVMCGDLGGLASSGCPGICGHFRLQHLPSGEKLQYFGLVGKLQHSGNGLRKASSRFEDQILDQRYMQTKSPGPAWKEGQPLSPSPFLDNLPVHLSPIGPSCLLP